MKLLENNFSVVSELTGFKVLTKLFLISILISTINTNSIKVLFFFSVEFVLLHVNSYLVCSSVSPALN